MKQTFSGKDIERWLAADAEDMPVEYERIRIGDIQLGHRISMFARMHEGAGLTQIALSEYGKALGYFAAASRAWADLLERHLNGDRIDGDLLEHCSSHPFNLALGAGDEPQIERLTLCYERAFPNARTGANSFHWSGAMLALLAAGKVEVASEWLTTPHPKLTDMSVRYFRSLVEGDEEALRRHSSHLTEDWKKTIRSERLGKFPDAVCDHLQIGVVRLAERLWGHRPNVDLAAAQIPPEIFDASVEPVEGTL